jgi:TonB family protein
MPRTLLLLLTFVLVAGLRAHVWAQAAPEKSAATQTAGEDDFARGKRLLAQGDAKKARQALEDALDLRMKAFSLELNEQRKADDSRDKVEADARRARFDARTKELIESVESFISVAGDKAEVWREWLETLRVYLQVTEDPKFDSTPFNLSRLFKPVFIIYKSEPQYTDAARNNNVQGTIRLRALLKADGTVGGVIVVRSLDEGLDKNAVAVARQIRFRPATFDGRPVAQFILLEYHFNTRF